jgi:arylsulfatase
MSDQFRADRVGVSINHVIHTPSLGRIASEGVISKRTYSSAPTCTPARTALLTGLSPWRHGPLGFGRVAERYSTGMPRLPDSM